jgi:hypothetical protein
MVEEELSPWIHFRVFIYIEKDAELNPIAIGCA